MLDVSLNLRGGLPSKSLLWKPWPVRQFHDVPTMLRGGLRMHDPQDGPRCENPTFRPEKGQSPSFHMSRMVGILSDYCFSIWTRSEFHGTSIVSWIFALKKDIKCCRNATEISRWCPIHAPWAFSFACLKISRTREAPTPTKSSMNSEALDLKKKQEVSCRFLLDLRIKKKVNEDHRKMWKTRENHNFILEKHSNILVNHLVN